MTNSIDLDSLIRAAVDSGITSTLIPRETADLMRARLDELIGAGHNHENGCLMCAVRALTEGVPRAWQPEEPGSITGVVLTKGSFPNPLSVLSSNEIRYVDLWLGGVERTRINAYGMSLSHSLHQADPQIGDTVTVTYLGVRPIERGKWAGREYKAFEVSVQRGHA